MTHSGVSQLRSMRPLASLSFVSSWDREWRLSASRRPPPLAKILLWLRHHQYWLWCQSMGGREPSRYQHGSLNVLGHARRAREVAESRNCTRGDAIVFGFKDMAIVDRQMQFILSNPNVFFFPTIWNSEELHTKKQAEAKRNRITGVGRFFNLPVVVFHSVFCTLLLSSWCSITSL